jgi:hypothetical protein
MLHQYDYRPRWTTIIGCLVFFGACAVVLGAKANGNHRGLIINGFVELSPGGASIFYWVLTAGSVGFVLLAAFLAIVRLLLRQRITLNEKCLIVPRSRWSSEELAVPFGNIQELTESKVHSQRFLKIVFSGGRFTLVAANLPALEDFDEIRELLAHRIDSSRSSSH